MIMNLIDKYLPHIILTALLVLLLFLIDSILMIIPYTILLIAKYPLHTLGISIFSLVVWIYFEYKK